MITVNNLSKSYGPKSVVSNVTAHFPARKLTSLIGPNGAGKTTLLMMIARLLDPTAGDILLENRNVAGLRPREYAKHVATLRQSPEFNLRLTVEELVAFGRFPFSRGALTSDDHTAIDEAISFLALDSLRRSYVDELSGGQRQMAFLAMVIAQQTQCLLLDEPLNNLDIKHALQIMRALRRLCDDHGRTVILVVHDINFAASYSDHIIAMKGGAVHCAGTVSEVLTETHLRELYGLDFEITRGERGCLFNYFNPPGEMQ